MFKKKCMYIAGAMALAASLFTGSAFAASSKFAAEVSNVTLITDTATEGTTEVLSASIHTPNKKDLLIGVSLETSLYTLTQVKGKHGETDTSDAAAGLKVSVSVDTPGVTVYPEAVYFDHRFQELSAVLGGVIESCQDSGTYTVSDPTDPSTCVKTSDTLDGKITVPCECIVADEEIQLILDTMGAHHFNFVAANLPSGDHTISVNVEVIAATTSTNGTASALAGVGKGSLTVEEVRATNSPDGINFVLE